MTTTPISTTLSSGWVSSVQALADATDEALLAIEGAKKAHVLKIRRALKKRAEAAAAEVEAAAAKKKKKKKKKKKRR